MSSKNRTYILVFVKSITTKNWKCGLKFWLDKFLKLVYTIFNKKRTKA